MSSASSAKAPGRRAEVDGHAAALVDVWTVHLPRLLAPWAPSLAAAVADGAWLAARPRVAAAAPIVALAIGMLAPLPWPGTGNAFVFSESLWFMALVAAGSLLSGTVGVMLLLGYICGDMLWESLRLQQIYGPSGSVWFAVKYRASRILSYVLLALLAYRVPRLAERLTDSLLVTIAKDGHVSVGWRAGIYSITCAVLVFLWCQAMVVLIRPVFTWVGLMPTVTAVAPVQQKWPWLVAAAALAAVARVLLARDVRVRPSMISEPRVRIKRRPLWIRVGSMAGSITLLMAGMYAGWLDAILTLFITSVLGIWHVGRHGRLPLRWVQTVHRVPAMLRFLVASLGGYLLSRQILAFSWPSESLRPVLMGSLATLAIFCVFFPAQRREPLVEQGTAK